MNFRKKIRQFKAVLLCMLTFSLLTNCSGPETQVLEIPNGLQVSTSEMNVRVKFFSDKAVYVEKWLKGTEPDTSSLIVIKNKLPKVEFEIIENDNMISMVSDKLTLDISKNDGQIRFKNESNSFLEETVSSMEPFALGNEKAYSVKQEFKLAEEEGIYGLGQHQDGYFNYRGKEVNLVQTNVDAVTPFFISSNKYGVLWDNYSKTVFKDTKESTSMWSEVGDNIRYYFIAGEDMDEVISGYRDLTGQAPMYGKWAYGYWQSKEHYDTRAELLSTAAEYRKRKIPIDNIVQDWDTWEGNENWNQLFFDAKKFPEPKEMLDILHQQNFHVMLSVWCSFGPNTPVYKEMEKNGFLIPVVGWAKFKYFDTYNPAANDLYWKYLNNNLFSIGIDAWWMDSTEPDIINALTKGGTEYEMKRVPDNHLGSFARYLNSYSLLSTESVYKNQRKTREKQRAYILTRSTFAGQQRAGATTWSGDIGASWDIYKKQIAAGVNHSMSGIPYWTFDIGAFVIGSYGGVFDDIYHPGYDELYTRMFQFGAFSPIFRSHGSERAREIWKFGKFAEPMIKFDNLRYRLMPYIYSLASKVTFDGYTIMRGLPMDFNEDKKTYSINDQFMFGPSIMVCPVTEYMYNKPPEKSVLVDSKHFKTEDGKQGLNAKYYKDIEYKELGKEKIDENININWYSTGRPEYVTDSTLSIEWDGKLIPSETGKHQFHIKCFGPKKLFIDGKELKVTSKSVEIYTETIDLEAGKEYDFRLETENGGPGALRVELFWKTPSIFAKEMIKETKEEKRMVYLPEGTDWYDFWTGEKHNGGTELNADAPIDKIPLYVKEGSIVPFGPFVQYASEKPNAPLEIRVYRGADGSFKLYEDEDDNYNYEKGAYSTIEFKWNDKNNELEIGERIGEFKGMVNERIFNIILVEPSKGVDVDVAKDITTTINYNGKGLKVKL